MCVCVSPCGSVSVCLCFRCNSVSQILGMLLPKVILTVCRSEAEIWSVVLSTHNETSCTCTKKSYFIKATQQNWHALGIPGAGMWRWFMLQLWIWWIHWCLFAGSLLCRCASEDDVMWQGASATTKEGLWVMATALNSLLTLAETKCF